MQRFRPSFEDGDELLGAGDGVITVLVKDPAFGLLGGAELFGQRIALGYKNVRINAAAFLQSGQQLILTGKSAICLFSSMTSTLQRNFRSRIDWRLAMKSDRMWLPWCLRL